MSVRLSSIVAVALAAGFAVVAPASAQPSGSYRDSCEDISAGTNTLRALCRTEDGEWNRTRLEGYASCTGDIANDDGRLVCRDDEDDRSYNNDDDDRRGAYNDDDDNDNDRADRRYGDDDSRRAGLPSGNYDVSCRRERVSRGVLYAECRDRDGNWRDASLDFRNCRREISNDNGRLVCGAPSFGARITLYQHVGYRGPSRTFSYNVPDLRRFGFSNTASSAYVQYGRWQVCTQPYYRGRCTTFRSSVSNFGRLGINDRVRSLRYLR